MTRIFIVDLTGEEPSFHAIKSSLPSSVPDFNEGGVRKRHFDWSNALKELRKDSPEINTFIESGTVPKKAA